MSTTNFFTEISKYAQQADLKMTFSMKGDIMTVSFLPELKGGSDKIVPFTASGTINELDEGFIPELGKAVDTAGGFKTNTEQLGGSVKDAKDDTADEKPKKVEQKKKSAAKKPATTKRAVAKKPPVKKPATPKKAVKKAAVKSKASPKPAAEPASEEAAPPPAKEQPSLF